MDDTAVHTVGRRRLDLKEAAAELGVTSEAIRRRAKRGTLPSEKGEDGRLYVWMTDVSARAQDVSDTGSHTVSDNGVHGVYDGGAHGGDGDLRIPDVLLERFEDENDFLRRELERLHRELERKDAILLTMAQRVPELEPAREASSEPRKASEPVSGGAGNGDDDATGSQKPTHPRSWLYRFFFGP